MNIEKRILQFKIDNIKHILNHSTCVNNGADVHVVANMRHVAGFIEDVLKDGSEYDVDFESIQEITEKLENQLTEYFKKKYPSPM